MFLKRDRNASLIFFLIAFCFVLFLLYNLPKILNESTVQEALHSDIFEIRFFFVLSLVLSLLVLLYLLFWTVGNIALCFIRFDITPNGILFCFFGFQYLLSWQQIGEICVCNEYLDIGKRPIVRVVKKKWKEKDDLVKQKKLLFRGHPKWLFYQYMGRHPFQIIRFSYSEQLERKIKEYYPSIVETRDG